MITFLMYTFFGVLLSLCPSNIVGGAEQPAAKGHQVEPGRQFGRVHTEPHAFIYIRNGALGLCTLYCEERSYVR